MNGRLRLKALALIAPILLFEPAAARAQLPFDVTQDDLAAVDTARFSWPSLGTSMGGPSGELDYLVEVSSEAECRAVGLLGMLRLRNYYMKRFDKRPVVLNLRVRCGPRYRGHIEYDGITTSFELREGPGGRVVYQGRVRGLP
ncbi:MAG: hypothetical protein GWN99_16465 [Gemmatimonadetes bacterium]|uniref:Uncharacterized protein n=1 Tax=Candidatus Kutchimonas denitrificans TaxID=3056748 RepID=A0AAE4Z7F4_9BACT|nr:hypothetical protein [Gemmatimonadota bacterium]NIR74383.1 hypothetical protein [Candidatus Kutchimonas denitrificans]NIS02634.1 hypothetical protein [Gemmatimonadota bacterium]NIT68509.1 hypothetical protein [Gemmatimonadota bacterium]NIU51986.1 hypothetical protein [Gemmatimonadota bacterium]